jgi:hypothetical protein
MILVPTTNEAGPYAVHWLREQRNQETRVHSTTQYSRISFNAGGSPPSKLLFRGWPYAVHWLREQRNQETRVHSTTQYSRISFNAGGSPLLRSSSFEAGHMLFTGCESRETKKPECIAPHSTLVYHSMLEVPLLRSFSFEALP